MATSGSVDYNQTRNEIINDAMQLIGVYGIGRTISAEDMKFANDALNKMIKAWQARGLHLWSKEEAYLFVSDNTGEYTLGSSASAARCAPREGSTITELSSDHTTSDTTIEVDSTSGMSASDIVGIVLDDDSVDWTTIVSVDSTTQITITSGLSSAAATDNNVYVFTSRVNKPLRIHSMRRIRGVSEPTSIPMLELSHEEYFDLPNKNMNGLPTHYYYNPDRDDGTLYLWPRPNDPEIYLGITYERQLEDLDASSDNVDFPTEWLECITYQLAVRLAPAFGKEQKVMQMVAPMAASLLENMLSWDAETATVKFVPGRR